jgi:hypothetical protein
LNSAAKIDGNSTEMIICLNKTNMRPGGRISPYFSFFLCHVSLFLFFSFLTEGIYILNFEIIDNINLIEKLATKVLIGMPLRGHREGDSR